MTSERRQLERAAPRLRNAPMRLRQWRDLLASDGVASIESKAGALVLAMRDGQLNMHYGFHELEETRRTFEALFDRLKPRLQSFRADYARIDLVQLPDRTWVEQLLYNVGFRSFGEWIEMEQPELDPQAPPPEVPEGIRLRRATPEDSARIVEIEADAHGGLGDGDAATRERIAGAGWVGVLEEQGELAGYAINAPVADGEGRVLSVAVDPEWWGEGYGQLLLRAATYQLAASGARRAVVRARPEIPQALKTAQAAGYSVGLRGIEWRRLTDEAAVAARWERERQVGVKARFGNWR